MEYRATIKDVENELDPIEVKLSEKDVVSLKYYGGDDKTQPIIGSEFNFSLNVDDCQALKYQSYFTIDEQRFRVNLYQNSITPDVVPVVWTGYLLPENYTEPYANKNFFVSFSSTDGIGLLKGKKLPEELYDQELSVTRIIGECLKLTALYDEFSLSPAIINASQDDYDKIYIDLKKYKDDELESAHGILEDILYSMRCQLFQSKGKWYVEGINKRQIITNTFKVYDYNGFYKSEYEESKNVKTLTYAAYPNLSKVAPLKEVTVISDVNELEFEDDIVSVGSDEFDLSDYNIYNYYFSKYWFPYGGYLAYIQQKKGDLLLSNISQIDDIDRSKYIGLKKQKYVLKGWKLKIKIEAQLKWLADVSPTNPDNDLVESWVNYLLYRVKIDDYVYYDSYGAGETDRSRIAFENSGKGEVELIFTVKESGYLDINFFEPYGDYNDLEVSGVYVTSLELENLNQKDENVTQLIIEENASQSTEIDLPISDDVTGESLSFQLDKLRQDNLSIYSPTETFDIVAFNKFKVNPLYYYYSVPLYFAKLADENPDNLQYYDGINFVNLEDFEVLYNFEGSEIFVIKTIKNAVTNEFKLTLRTDRKSVIPMDEWGKWSDSIYKFEEKPYNEIVAEIEQRLFGLVAFKLEGDVLNSIKINDIISFKIEQGLLAQQKPIRYFTPSDCEWFIGNNNSNVILQECNYNGYSFGQIPPFVSAGNDITFSDGQIVLVTEANAFSPDGTIDTIEWVKLSGDNADIFNGDTLMPSFLNLDGYNYEFQITVTDNRGNVATDTVNVNRVLETEIKFNVTEDQYIVDDNLGSYDVNCRKVFDLYLDPPLPNTYRVNINYTIKFININGNLNGETYGIAEPSFVDILINKNIYNRWNYDEDHPVGSDGIADAILAYDKEYKDVVSISNTDSIEMEINILAESYISIGVYPNVKAIITFDSYEVVNGFVEINNIGVSEQIHAIYP